ncbi:MAG: glycosyltransferase family 9 protein, partial [Acidobacteriota bacterium]
MKIGEKADSIRVLVLAGLTEVILAMPALRALRAHFPAARISVLTSPAGSELIQTVPWLDEAIGIGRLRKGEV